MALPQSLPRLCQDRSKMWGLTEDMYLLSEMSGVSAPSTHQLPAKQLKNLTCNGILENYRKAQRPI